MSENTPNGSKQLQTRNPRSKSKPSKPHDVTLAVIQHPTCFLPAAAMTFCGEADHLETAQDRCLSLDCFACVCPKMSKEIGSCLILKMENTSTKGSSHQISNDWQSPFFQMSYVHMLHEKAFQTLIITSTDSSLRREVLQIRFRVHLLQKHLA